MTGDTVVTKTIFSPAKINLFLHITGRRDDGYHYLQSVFRAINFGDAIHFELCPHSQELVQLFGAQSITERVEDNLIVKAVQLLATRFPNHAVPVVITLQKRIPQGAGLGGGSSNCASTLMALNELWQLGLSCQELMEQAVILGADVPFFIFSAYQKSDAIAMGIGECLTPIHLPKRHYLLLMPDSHLATARLFADERLQKNCPVIENLQQRTVCFLDVLDGVSNVFEPLAIALSPQVAQALTYLKELQRHTHTHARMTGTGSVVFLPILNPTDASIQRYVDNAPCPAMLVESLYGGGKPN